MAKYLNEFLGTFFLSLAIITSLLILDMGNYQPFVIGTILVGLIYGDRKISGAHYNPAVTIGFWIRGRCPLPQALGYIAVQLLAGMLAAVILLYFGHFKITQQLDLMPMSIAEVLGTIILVYVILFVATAKATEGNSYYGLVIGYTVTLCAYSFGDFGSYGCFNPAVALATLLTGINTFSNFIVIVLSNITGGVIAAFLFHKVYPKSNS